MSIVRGFVYMMRSPRPRRPKKTSSSSARRAAAPRGALAGCAWPTRPARVNYRLLPPPPLVHAHACPHAPPCLRHRRARGSHARGGHGLKHMMKLLYHSWLGKYLLKEGSITEEKAILQISELFASLGQNAINYAFRLTGIPKFKFLN